MQHGAGYEKPEGFIGWWGNRAREDPGGWAVTFMAEFPSFITHLLQSSRSREQSRLPLPCSWAGPLAGGAGVWCLGVLTYSL